MHILQKILPLCESIEQLYWLESSFKQIRYCLWIAWPTLHQLAVPSSTLGYANWTRKIYSKIQRWISDETAWVVGCSLGWIHRCKYHSFKQKSKWIFFLLFLLRTLKAWVCVWDSLPSFILFSANTIKRKLFWFNAWKLQKN